MKIEKLNENKIKITLSMADLEERNIDLQSFIYNSPESQELFWDMMSKAEREYGFDFDESMIYVEAASTGSGTFTLIVTKSDSNVPSQLLQRNKIKNKSFKLKRKNATLNAPKVLYVFNSFDDICAFCQTIDLKQLPENTLYELNGEYYLEIANMPFHHILDFATIVPSAELYLGKLNEYGTTIVVGNALQEIGKHFIKRKKLAKKVK